MLERWTSQELLDNHMEAERALPGPAGGHPLPVNAVKRNDVEELIADQLDAGS